jgi:hypothetical protein
MHTDAHRGGGSADGRDPGKRVAEAGQRATLETGVRDFVPGLQGRITPPSSLASIPFQIGAQLHRRVGFQRPMQVARGHQAGYPRIGLKYQRVSVLSKEPLGRRVVI